MGEAGMVRSAAAGIAMTPSPFLIRLAPAVFVVIWSTGWIVARYAAPYADPLTFLALRYLLAGGVLLALSLAMRASWPSSRRAVGHALVSGVLLHAIYLGGVWWAIARGLPAGVSALIAALQPILTALLAPRLIGEPIQPRQWLGIGIGFVGIGLVLAPKLANLAPGQLSNTLAPVAVNVAGMLSVTLGTFYQKRFIASGDLRTVTALQYAGAFLVTAPFAAMLEPMRIDWNPTVVATMAWSVLGLSIGAIGLLLMLIRQGAVSRAAALVYLVPPTAALMAYVLFGETLNLMQIIGMGLTAIGVILASRRAPPTIKAKG
jgi:drug/metabolite transporter (DMT)-like permease